MAAHPAPRSTGRNRMVCTATAKEPPAARSPRTARDAHHQPPTEAVSISRSQSRRGVRALRATLRTNHRVPLPGVTDRVG